MSELWPASQYGKEDTAFCCPVPLPEATAPGSRTTSFAAASAPAPVHSLALKLISHDFHHTEWPSQGDGGHTCKPITGPVPFQPIPARPSQHHPPKASLAATLHFSLGKNNRTTKQRSPGIFSLPGAQDLFLLTNNSS